MKKINLILAIAGAIFSGLCALNAIYSGATTIEFIAAVFLVGFLTYLQFQWFDILFYFAGDVKRSFAGIGAVVLFCIQVSGNTVFWLSSQNTEAASLAVLEHNLKVAEGDKITAQALLSNCNNIVVKGCIKPRSEELKAKEQTFNSALAAYNGQIKAITHSDSFKIASSFIGGIDHKQFIFLRALIGSFFFEIGIIYCWLASRAKSLDKRDVEIYKEPNIEIKLDKNAEFDVMIYDVWLDFKSQNMIKDNGLPVSMKKFTQEAWKNEKTFGSTYNQQVLASLTRSSLVAESH